MGDIYRNGESVICMLGGVSAVQSIFTPTGWIDRAWTLQEALLNPNTHAYVAWTVNEFPFAGGWDELPDTRRFINKDAPRDQRECLIPLCDLFKVAFCDRYDMKLACLNGNLHPEPITARLAIKSVMWPVLVEQNLTGIWCAMLMRTSTRVVDIAYSVMGFFNVQLDPYHEDRKLQDVFNELARKAATRGGNGMGWLLMGGVSGPYFLKRDQSSLIIPKVPEYGGSQGVPYYTSDRGIRQLAADVFTNYSLSLKIRGEYHIKFDTDSQPHIMCGVMFKDAGDETPRNIINLRGVGDGRLYENVKYEIRGDNDIPSGVVILLVATTDFERHSSKAIPDRYVLFLKWSENGWVLVADGNITMDIDEHEIKKMPRRHFTIGKGSQVEVCSWACDHDCPKIRTAPLPSSYGILLLEDYGVKGSKKLNKVIWFGKKASYALSSLMKFLIHQNGP
jgi:hypothetical protein